MSGLKWFAIPNPPGRPRAPEWVRSAAIDQDGAVFVPAIMAGNEQRVVLCAAYDGVEVVIEKGHVFVPTAWLRREYPDVANICDRVEERMKEAAGL